MISRFYDLNWEEKNKMTLGKPTIADVAKLANVSQTTVSGVMNNSRRYSKATNAKVHQAMQDLGYFPRVNKLRQANIKKQDHEKIVLMTNDTVASGLSTTLFQQLIAGVEQGLLNTTYTLAVECLKPSGDLPDILCRRPKVKGVIMRHGYSPLPSQVFAQNNQILHGLPIVDTFTHDYHHGDCVSVDNESCAYWAFQKTVADSPEKIYCVFPLRNQQNMDVFLRKSIFEFLLKNAGLPCSMCICPDDMDSFVPDDWSEDTKSAIFVVAHDFTVNAVINGLSSRNHKSKVFAIMTGELTTERKQDFVEVVHIDPFLIGVKAAQMLCRRIQHPYEPFQRINILPRELQSILA